jgi:hypothetical protein
MGTKLNWHPTFIINDEVVLSYVISTVCSNEQ